MKSWLIRLAIVYLVLYALPFPLTLLGYVTQIPLLGDIPGLGAALGWITGLYGQVMNPLASWVGDIVFGVAATPEGTGSGDRTFNYLQLLVTAGLALIGGSAWSAIAARQVSPKTVDAALILARYYLATTLLTYGWAKLFPLQFPIPGPDRGYLFFVELEGHESDKTIAQAVGILKRKTLRLEILGSFPATEVVE